jgi:hypothetical protein
VHKKIASPAEKRFTAALANQRFYRKGWQNPDPRVSCL